MGTGGHCAQVGPADALPTLILSPPQGPHPPTSDCFGPLLSGCRDTLLSPNKHPEGTRQEHVLHITQPTPTHHSEESPGLHPTCLVVSTPTSLGSSHGGL
jgi:hypothetical protein